MRLVLVALSLIHPLHGNIEPLRSEVRDQRLRTTTVEAPKETVIRIESDVLFAFDSARIGREAADALDAVARRLEARTGCARVVGFTDSRGAAAYNQRLSERRAEAVRRKLAPHGCVSASGRGEAAPVASNKHAAGRQLNRRVEVHLPR